MAKQMKITAIKTVKCNTRFGEKDKHLVSVEGAQKQASSFVGDWNKNWKVGDTITAEVKINGEYVNFECPPELKSQNSRGVSGGLTQGDRDMLARIEQKLDRVLHIIDQVEADEEYSEGEIETEEVPLPDEPSPAPDNELGF